MDKFLLTLVKQLVIGPMIPMILFLLVVHFKLLLDKKMFIAKKNVFMLM